LVDVLTGYSCYVVDASRTGDDEGSDQLINRRPDRATLMHTTLTGKVCFTFAMLFLLLHAPIGALAQPMAKTEPADDPRNQICQLIEAAAKANALPIDFFARLIWQESRFQPDEIGPVTRNGQRAQGIAQFMPGTAAERQLLEPFNPIEALPKSGEFLAELARSSAISDLRLRPIMPVRSVSVIS
jgi:hypothetical protein